MIGQTVLRQQLQHEWDNNRFAHFTIIVGPRGSGKKTLISTLFKPIYIENNKVESVRKMIELAYKVSHEVFVIPDADTMSVSGKQALLKLFEECPNDNYFIMTLQDRANVPMTIRSRARIYSMSIYTPADIQYYVENFLANPGDFNKITQVVRLAENPGEANILWSYDMDAFHAFVESVFHNIAEVSGANAFKIADRISMKDDDKKYDLALFLKLFSHRCIEEIKHGDLGDSVIKYSRACIISSKYMRQARISGINKRYVFDNWILEIRREWM